MNEKLSPCPFCQKPLTLGGGVNPYGRCETPDCWLNERRISISLDVPKQLEQWNRRTPAPEGEAWGYAVRRIRFDSHDAVIPDAPWRLERGLALQMIRADPERWEVQPLYASPVVPVGSGQADKMAHVLRGMVKRGTLIDDEAIESALTLATYRQDPDDDDRAWAASQAEVIGQPVVPVGSGEPVARATCQDCGGHIEGWICQSCGREFRENDAGNLVFENQPVVPVGVSREEIVRLLDAIIAALRPTDTGGE